MCGRSKQANIVSRLKRAKQQQQQNNNTSTKSSSSAASSKDLNKSKMNNNNNNSTNHKQSSFDMFVNEFIPSEQMNSPSSDNIKDYEKYKHLHNTGPGHYQLILKSDMPPTPDAIKKTTWSLSSSRWGLIPSYTKSPLSREDSDPYRFHNARLDGINGRGTTTKQTFMRLLEKGNRCIIFVDGFYEWKQLSNKKKQPYYIYHKNKEEPLMLAGLWDVWKDKSINDDGITSSITSHIILTMDSSSNLSTIHHRMPVLLTPESASIWLNDPNAHNAVTEIRVQGAKAALKLFQCHPVTNKVSKSTYQKSDCSIHIDQNSSSIMNFFGGGTSKKKKKTTTKTKKNVMHHKRKLMNNNLNASSSNSNMKKVKKQSKSPSELTKGQMSMKMFFMKK